MRDLAISLLYQRMREDPESIGSRELASFVVQAMKSEDPDKSNNEADAILEQLGRAS